MVSNGRDRAVWGAGVILCLASAAAYILWAYPRMPEQVPVHWGPSGAVDAWGPKSSTIWLAFLPLGIVLLFLALPHLDPKGRSFEDFKGVYQGLGLGTAAFVALAGWMTPLTVFGVLPDGGGSLVTTLVFAGVGVLMIALGACMPHVAPNYTFGIRLPWTLADEGNWRRTHRFAGPVYMACGFAALACALLAGIAPDVAVWVVTALVLGATAVVAAYSWLLWRGTIR